MYHCQYSTSKVCAPEVIAFRVGHELRLGYGYVEIVMRSGRRIGIEIFA